MITSKIKSKDGKVIFKKYLKLFKCLFRFKDNGYIYKQFLHHNKISKGNFKVIFINLEFLMIGFHFIWREFRNKNIFLLFFLLIISIMILMISRKSQKKVRKFCSVFFNLKEVHFRDFISWLMMIYSNCQETPKIQIK